MNKNRLLLCLIYIAGFLSLLAFIVTKNEDLMDLSTSNMFKDGDLYRFAKVLSFKTKLPPADYEDLDYSDVDPDTSAIIIIGDSFMETCRGHKPFPMLLSEQMGQDVYPVYAGIEPAYFDPVYFCWKNSLDPDKKRIIILERVERYIIDYFGERQREDTIAFHRAAKNHSWWHDVKRHWFTGAEKNFQVLMTSSNLTSPVMELWNTFRFVAFKQISEETPLYSLDPPFLFDKEEVVQNLTTSYYYPHTDTLIDQIASNILLYKKLLQSRYNAELVFMPVPNPYTLYHTLINSDPYDGFVPKLCGKLERKGVRTISLYDKFCESKKRLYFPTDTHWNADGVQIAVDQTVNLLSRLRHE